MFQYGKLRFSGTEGMAVDHFMRDSTRYLLDSWQHATLTDYSHLVLAAILCSWFVSRYWSRGAS